MCLRPLSLISVILRSSQLLIASISSCLSGPTGWILVIGNKFPSHEYRFGFRTIVSPRKISLARPKEAFRLTFTEYERKHVLRFYQSQA